VLITRHGARGCLRKVSRATNRRAARFPFEIARGKAERIIITELVTREQKSPTGKAPFTARLSLSRAKEHCENAHGRAANYRSALNDTRRTCSPIIPIAQSRYRSCRRPRVPLAESTRHSGAERGGSAVRSEGFCDRVKRPVRAVKIYCFSSRIPVLSWYLQIEREREGADDELPCSSSPLQSVREFHILAPSFVCARAQTRL